MKQVKSLSRSIKRGHFVWRKDNISGKDELFRVMRNKKLEYTGIYVPFKNNPNDTHTNGFNDFTEKETYDVKSKNLWNRFINFILSLLNGIGIGNIRRRI